MDVLTLALAVLAVFALVALAAGEESRDGFEQTDPDRFGGR